MDQYEKLLAFVLGSGIEKADRTGVGTRSVFGETLRFDLNNGFPLITTKKVHLKSIIYELLWFMRGETNIKFLKDHSVSIWDEWADDNGELGPIYGFQWRHWNKLNGGFVDQIQVAIDSIKKTPDSRRIIVSAWNVGDLSKMALLPCHIIFQFYVANGSLSCFMFQRSADMFLGLPFNIASYSLLLMMMAQVCELRPKDLIIAIGDAHIYLNHMEQVKLQLSREPRPFPTMSINEEVKNINDFKYSDFGLTGYDPHPSISAPIAI